MRTKATIAAPETRSRRRILMIAPTSFFADYGCHVRILEEARVLQRLGQQVTIVTYYNGRDPEGIDVRRTLPIPWRRGYEVGSSRHKLAFDALLGAAALGVALRTRPDIVHGHLHEGALIGGVIARLLRRPLVFDFQGSLSSEMIDHGFLDPDGRFFQPVRWLEDHINRLPQAIVTSTIHATGQLAAGFAVDEANVHALPDCVDATAFRPDLLTPASRARALRDLGIPPDRKVVVYLGLLARHQGTDLLLQAGQRVVAARPETHFLVMGFPGSDIYAAQASALGITGHVTFTGRIPYEDAAQRLALGELAVAPKVSDTEGSGKVLNYMAMGLPTVAFDTPVSREYMHQDGVYARRGDAASLADEILALLAEPDRMATLGARLRQRALADYDWDRAGRMLLDIYDRTARSVRPGGRP